MPKKFTLNPEDLGPVAVQSLQAMNSRGSTASVRRSAAEFIHKLLTAEDATISAGDICRTTAYLASCVSEEPAGSVAFVSIQAYLRKLGDLPPAGGSGSLSGKGQRTLSGRW